MDNLQNVCLKVKKQKNISPLITVIWISYILLTEGQEYNFHGMKLNILKNNMHWGVFHVIPRFKNKNFLC